MLGPLGVRADSGEQLQVGNAELAQVPGSSARRLVTLTGPGRAGPMG